MTFLWKMVQDADITVVYRTSTPLYMRMRTREGCGLGLHVLSYIAHITVGARAANKH